MALLLPPYKGWFLSHKTQCQLKQADEKAEARLGSITLPQQQHGEQSNRSPSCNEFGSSSRDTGQRTVNEEEEECDFEDKKGLRRPWENGIRLNHSRDTGCLGSGVWM